MLIRKIKAFFNPEQYHGWGKKRNFFEGWYYKAVDSSGNHPFAVIPGIAMDGEGNRHSFIQVLNGTDHSSDYHRFDAEKFNPEPGKLEIRLDGNFFSEDRMSVRLPGLEGELHFSGNVPWPKPWYSPGIMGPYSFAPFMECYHGIVSLDHEVSGWLKTDERMIDFTGGRGYIEKDWGRSFPSAYVWMQSNHFSRPGISFKASVARIPWIGSAFTGFIAGLWYDGRLIRFTTYNKTSLIKLDVAIEKVNIILQNRHFLLEIDALRKEAAELASPIRGFMDGRIEESMASEIHVRLINPENSKILFDDTGSRAGLEVAGDIEKILIH